MAVTGNFVKLYNMIGIQRNLLSSRIILPTYQPIAMLKVSLEESAGLPPKPKRPLTPYFKFMNELRPTIAQKNPTLRVTGITKILAEEWQKADVQMKEKMQKEYQTNIEKYRIAIAEYLSNITEEQKEQLEMAKLERKKAKIEKVHQKTIKSLGKPKRPPVAFTIWLRSLELKRGSQKLSDWRRALEAKWDALPEQEKSVFEHKATEVMNAYKTDLKNWETKMIKSGHYDMIRHGTKLNPKNIRKAKKQE